MYDDEFLDRDGKPLDMIDFLTKMADRGYRTVGYYQSSTQEEEVSVITIWTGISSALFKTYVEGGAMNGYEAKYDNEIDALIGHEDIIISVNDLL
jgi:hypothetical protein